MSKRMLLNEYLELLKLKEVQSYPLENPIGRTKKIKHRCQCGNEFIRSPKDMLSRFATGVCDKCHKEIKHKNKLNDGVDNGYYEILKKRNHSLPVNKSDFKNRHVAIIHQCKSCNSTYYKIPAKALRMNSLGVCNRCGILEKAKMKKAKGFKVFKSLMKLKKIKYISGYDGIKEKCVFQCNCGERFLRSPQKVKQGQVSCLECSQESRSRKQTLSISEHNIKMREMGFRAKLLSQKIINNSTPLKYQCECGEIFYRKYSKMFSKGAWGICEKCYCKRNSKSQERTTVEYDIELLKVRPGVIRIGPYLGSQVKTQHLCVCGNDQWFPKPNNVLHSLDSCGCQKGKKCENLIRQIFEHLTGKKFPSIKADFIKNPKTGVSLQLDGYCEELKLAFEYDGIQHSDPRSHFHKNSNEFYELQERDKYKNIRCAQLGILLIRFNNLEKTLRKLISGKSELVSLIKLIQNELNSNSIQIVNNEQSFKVKIKNL